MAIIRNPNDNSQWIDDVSGQQYGNGDAPSAAPPVQSPAKDTISQPPPPPNLGGDTSSQTTTGTKDAQPRPIGTGGINANDIGSWYQQYLGRAPSTDELGNWGNGTYGDPNASGAYVKNQIATSGEGQAYAAAHPPAAPASASGPASPSPGSAQPGPAALNIPAYTSPLQGQTNAALGGVVANGGHPTPSPTGASGLSALKSFLDTNGSTTARIGALRDQMATLRKGQVSDLDARLADRGLLSEAGHSQGADLSAQAGLERDLGAQYSAAAASAIPQLDANMLQAAGMATGLDQQAVGNLLSTATTADQQQQILGNLAVQSLSQNTQWNEFLASYGLQRDQVEYAIQNNQISQLMPLINAFLEYTQTGAAGYV